MHHVDNLVFDKYKDSIKLQSAVVQQKAEDHVAQADNIQSQVQQTVINQLSKEKADQNAQLIAAQNQLRDSTNALHIASNSLRVITSSGGGATSSSQAASDQLADQIRAELNNFHDAALAIASKGDAAIVERNACIDIYNGAVNAVNTNEK
jgi:hypothetical protein